MESICLYLFYCNYKKTCRNRHLDNLLQKICTLSPPHEQPRSLKFNCLHISGFYYWTDSPAVFTLDKTYYGNCQTKLQIPPINGPLVINSWILLVFLCVSILRSSWVFSFAKIYIFWQRWCISAVEMVEYIMFFTTFIFKWLSCDDIVSI